jgi:Mrp family chromosome partitioning ATPase
LDEMSKGEHRDERVQDEPTPGMLTMADHNHVKHMVGVMSGKGGVGKSFVTGLLALGLVQDGYKVGILDADVTGPSIPRMFGLTERPGSNIMGLLPVKTSLGIKVMSINLLLEREDEAVIWRGPLIGKVIQQFWNEVMWGDLDYLLLDLPPGTADVPLTIMQSLPLNGVVVVSTPQDMVGMVVRKAVRMAEQMSVSILGVVENMSYFVCPDTGKRHEIFGASRGEKLAAGAGAPLLGRLPIDPEVSKLCDTGWIETYKADGYRELARSVVRRVEATDPPREPRAVV